MTEPTKLHKWITDEIIAGMRKELLVEYFRGSFGASPTTKKDLEPIRSYTGNFTVDQKFEILDVYRVYLDTSI